MSLLDIDNDGKISKPELVAFYIKLFAPYALIIIGIFAPPNIQQLLVGGGLSGAGLTGAEEIRKRRQQQFAARSNYHYGIVNNTSLTEEEPSLYTNDGTNNDLYSSENSKYEEF